MITPFLEDDSIDPRALQKEAQYLQALGVNGIVVGGSTGEGAGLSEQEVAEIVRLTVEAVGGKLPVIGGIIADTSEEAIRLGLAAKRGGACGLQVQKTNTSRRQPQPHSDCSEHGRQRYSEG